MLAWTQDYKIGHDLLDSQHLLLFALINQIDINIQTKHAGELVTDVLGGLAFYTERHFEAEEALMRETGYPSRNLHHHSHLRLLEQLSALTRAAAEVDDRLGHALKTRKFVIDWLVGHILDEDAAFVEWTRSAGAAP